MDASILEKYIGKIYGYAVNNTFTREEADELSQEILFTAVCELSKLRNENRFEPWLWGIARNVTNVFKRKRGKENAIYSYDVPDNVIHEIAINDEPVDDDEIYDYLREKIAMLSSIYRNIIIYYYYDNLSIKEISKRLAIPEGTVTWRLSEARRKLRKEYDSMNETALKPHTFRIDIYGSGEYNGKNIPFPDVYISDILSQNILFFCYDSARTIEELAKLCGVPAYYIEDRIDNLIKREAIIEQNKGKYRTDFIIWSDKYGIYCEENAENLLLPIADRLIEALEKIAVESNKINFYKAEKHENDLWYLYGAMAFGFISQKYCKLPYPRIKTKYDGYDWCYIGNMESGNHHRIIINEQCCFGGKYNYRHICYSFQGIQHRQMMSSNCSNSYIDILTERKTEDVDSLSLAIMDGYIIRKRDGSFLLTVPVFDVDQYRLFLEIADKYLAPLIPEYSDIVNKFIQGYKQLFPKHLENDADRMCQLIYRSMFMALIFYGQRTGKIPLSSEGNIVDVIVQHK